MRTTWRPAAGFAVVLLTAAACGSYGGDDDAATTPSDAATPDGVLSTAGSDLGEIVVDAEGRTSLERVWAGGDCVLGGPDLTVAAVEDGKRAALSIDRHLAAAAPARAA